MGPPIGACMCICINMCIHIFVLIGDRVTGVMFAMAQTSNAYRDWLEIDLCHSVVCTSKLANNASAKCLNHICFPTKLATFKIGKDDWKITVIVS